MADKRPRIILASRSPRRADLLVQLGLKFKIVPSSVREDMDYRENPEEIVTALALQKARDVARRVRNGLVIGADTVVLLEREILGKPASAENAREMLFKLSGKEHRVLTGVALAEASGKRTEKQGLEITHVKFRELNRQEIFSYVATGEPLDKAGAYGIQGKGAVFVEKINGCYFNVVGLPLFLLSKMLNCFGVNIFQLD